MDRVQCPLSQRGVGQRRRHAGTTNGGELEEPRDHKPETSVRQSQEELDNTQQHGGCSEANQ